LPLTSYVAANDGTNPQGTVSKFEDHLTAQDGDRRGGTMLEDCLFASRPSASTKKPFTLVVSILTHVTIAAVLILIPLFQNHLLPEVPFFEPLRPPTLAAQSVELVPASRPPSGSTAPMPQSSRLLDPVRIPDGIRRLVDEPVPATVGFLPGTGSRGGQPLPFGVDPFAAGPSAGPPLPPPAPPPAPPAPPNPVDRPAAPVRRGGELMQSRLLHSVTPEYPRLAIITRTEGVVQIEAVITREGIIDPARLRVISGHVLLVEAAVEAVKQWRYRPTLLNGEPVEVLTTITLNFTLN
jgi:protein TonB